MQRSTLLGNTRGIALIITLLVITLMVVAILEFNSLMRMNGQAAGNFRDQTGAYYLAKAGINASFALLANEQSFNDLMNILIKGEEYGFIPIGSPILESEDAGTYKYVISKLPISEGYLTIEVKDEDSKFNINNLVTMTVPPTGSPTDQSSQPKQQPQQGQNILALGKINLDIHNFVQRLFQLLGIDTEVLYALEDWLDFGEGDTEQGQGTEGGLDMLTNQPYRVKNGPLETITEIRMIKGINDEVLSSLGTNMEEGFLNPGSNKFLTVYPTNGVNINTAPSSLLQALSDKITPDVAKDIIAARRKNPFQNTSSFRNQYNTDPKIFLTTKSSFFRVKAMASYNNIMRVITAVVRRQANSYEIFYWRVD